MMATTSGGVTQPQPALQTCVAGLGFGAGFLQALRHPELDDGLPRHAQALGLLIQGVNHPDRKIDVHAPLLPASRLRQVHSEGSMVAARPGEFSRDDYGEYTTDVHTSQRRGRAAAKIDDT